MVSWNPPPHKYNVTESTEFQERSAAFAGTPQQWDEIKETIDQDLAKNPYEGFKVPNSSLWTIQIDIWPPLTVYYTIDDEKLEMTLVEMRVHDPVPRILGPHGPRDADDE
jgi:hypothetical protein